MLNIHCPLNKNKKSKSAYQPTEKDLRSKKSK